MSKIMMFIQFPSGRTYVKAVASEATAVAACVYAIETAGATFAFFSR